MNDKHTIMSDNLPEEIWVFKGAKKGTIIVDTIPDDNTAYRLKSTVDAQRAEDSKTIRQLANAANRLRCAQDKMLHKWSEGDDSVKHDLWKKLHEAGKDMLSALDAHAPRIAEAQDGEG